MPYGMSLPVGDRVTFPRDSEIKGDWATVSANQPELEWPCPLIHSVAVNKTALSSMALDPFQARGRVLQSNINQ